MVITQWEIQCLGIPLDNGRPPKNDQKASLAFHHGTGTPSIMQSVRHSIVEHFHVLLTIQFSCLHLDLWVGTCWIRASIAELLVRLQRKKPGFMMVYGLWDMRHFSSVVDEREIFNHFNRYTTMLNTGLLKVIQFKHGTLGSLGPQHWGFCAAVTSKCQEWGPDVDTTTADWSTTNSWNVQPRSLHGDVVAMTPWSGAGCRESTAVDRMTLWVMTGTGWGEDLNVVYICKIHIIQNSLFKLQWLMANLLFTLCM